MLSSFYQKQLIQNTIKEDAPLKGVDIRNELASVDEVCLLQTSFWWENDGLERR